MKCKAITALHIIQTEGISSLLRRTFDYSRSEPYFFTLLSHWYKIRYNTDLDPLKLIHVAPSEIREISPFRTTRNPPAWNDIGKIRSSGWKSHDDRCPFEATPVYSALRQRFEDGKRWEEIEGWNKSDHRNQEIELLYESIRTEGLMPRKEIKNASYPASHKRKFNEFVTSLDDIMVDIDKDGSLLFRGCNHRLAIAKLLNLEEIPVRVCIRHTEWMRKRDQLYDEIHGEEEGLVAIKYGDHPDMQDIII